MRKTRRILSNTLVGRAEPDAVRFVLVVSRTAGQEILFGDQEKETFRKILFKQLLPSLARGAA